jgi:predicted nucleic acid-binding protein
MSEAFSRPVVLDATVLSNFASTDSITWLTATFDGLMTVPAVKNELRRGTEVGYEYLTSALGAIENGEITIDEAATEVLEQAYPKIRDRLDPGEAEALVAADRIEGTLVTDDGTARQLASSHEIELTGSIGLLVRGIIQDELTVETANSWLQTWVDERSYYAPVESVSDVLPDEYR